MQKLYKHLLETKLMADKTPNLEKQSTNDFGSVSFTCPVCKKAVIKRTSHERKAGVKYICNECGFSGPN